MLFVAAAIVVLRVVVVDNVVGVVGGASDVVDVVTHSGLCTSPKSLKDK